ncbi:hypothetical protein GTA08_BOTSDO03354 [Neofusicoccum parvum]|uniref:Cyanovirin-N domain-containing protein n=2 Tax=Neofusicoccum parvum TaxID=310453 RepID=R1GDL8_BOTPV|nr:hypothetical protein UCRNP2_6936 [Neofusicoccum parvum UCRNP2]GME32042.1 hypothetical protein GTA08_BOTSDO03354 [Neofusicoccum parvum]GME59445.1 hypothetical protein GTA08_BOTSDO03354 [Neofusicoccum parvum]
MRFTATFFVTLFASLVASETLDLSGKCDSHNGVYSWDCNINQEDTAALTCNSRLSGGGSYCSDCVRLDTPGFFECTCSGNECP